MKTREMHIKKIMFVIILLVTGVANANTVLIGGKKDESFSSYTVRKGETLSEIAWVLGVQMNTLTNWNRDILKKGIRRLQTGMKLKYRLPQDTTKIVTDNMNEINEKVEDISQTVSSQTQETRNIIQTTNDETKEVINKKIQDAENSITGQITTQKKETKQLITKAQKEIIKNSNDNTKKILSTIKDNGTKSVLNNVIKQVRELNMLLGLSAVIFVAILFLILLKLNEKHYHQKDELVDVEIEDITEKEKTAENNTNSSKLNSVKLNSVKRGELCMEDGEKRIDFSIKDVGDFSIALPSNSNEIESIFLLPNKEWAKYKKERDVKQSVKKSFRNYLYDNCDTETKIKINFLIGSKKIVRR